MIKLKVMTYKTSRTLCIITLAIALAASAYSCKKDPQPIMERFDLSREDITVGTTTGQNSTNENVDRDLFGWGTSGWPNGNVYYQPYDTQDN